MSQELIAAIADMREEDALRITNELLDAGTDPLRIIDACKEAMGVIGGRYEAGEAFVPELIMAGEMMGQISEIVKPQLQAGQESARLGKVLMATVVGDIHDIGKDIVVFMLDVNGFEVIDLGVDVPPATIVEKIRENRPAVVGLSGLLTVSFDGMKSTVDAIREAGLRDSVKVMLGGAPVDERVTEYAGADAWGKDAVEAVSLAKQWVGGK